MISSSFQLLFRFASLTSVTSTTSASASLNSQCDRIGDWILKYDWSLTCNIVRKPTKRFNIVECWKICLIEIKTFISQKKNVEQTSSNTGAECSNNVETFSRGFTSKSVTFCREFKGMLALRC